jgi:polar amino acid transport system substrate-binding protein
MIRKYCIVFYLLLSFQIIAYAKKKEIIEFSMIDNDPSQEISARILQVIYSKLKINIHFICLPGRRSIEEAINGRSEGETNRLYQFGEKYPMFIRITPSTTYLEPSIFSKNQIKVNGWESISNYRIGIIKGIIYAENGTKGMPHVTAVNTLEQLVLMLQTNRIDLFITDKFNGIYTLKKMKLENEAKIISSPIIKKLELYHYIHNNYKYLVPIVEKVVQNMNANGELEALSKKFKKELYNTKSKIICPTNK